MKNKFENFKKSLQSNFYASYLSPQAKSSKLKAKSYGFTLLMSALVASLLIAIGLTLFNIAFKEILLSSLGRDSQAAFYAADSGAECALYWDWNYQGGGSAFSTSSPSGSAEITCPGGSPDPISTGSQTYPDYPVYEEGQSVIGGPEGDPVSSFGLKFLPGPYCAYVRVLKCTPVSGGGCPENFTGTVIESLGYNTCDLTSARRVERAVRLKY